MNRDKAAGSHTTIPSVPRGVHSDQSLWVRRRAEGATSVNILSLVAADADGDEFLQPVFHHGIAFCVPFVMLWPGHRGGCV